MEGKVFLRSILAATVSVATYQSAAASELFGQWRRGDGHVQIRIASCGTALCATNTWVRDDNGREKVGEKLIFKNLTQDREGWVGSAYDPQRNLTVSARLKLVGNRLVSSGCVLGGVICRSVDWTRVE